LLSGFVVAYAYDERPGRSSLTWRQFMAVRMIRLYPMLSQAHKHEFHVPTLLLVAAGSFAVLPTGLAVGTVAYPLNIAVWSLFFEFAINAVYGSRFGKLGKWSLAAPVVASRVALDEPVRRWLNGQLRLRRFPVNAAA